MSRTVLAFDPGGRKSGVVLRDGETLLGWRLERRSSQGRMPRDGYYLRQVVGAGVALLTAAGIDPADRSAYIVGCEEVQYWPSNDPAVRRDERGLYGTAMVYGAVLLRWPDATVVESGRGVAKLHRLSYPSEIRQPERSAGADRLVDVRAAWDHSHAAETLFLRAAREHRP